MKYVFELDDNTDDKVVNIEDKLINTFECAKSRAVSEFLQNSYKKQMIAVSTYHIDGIKLGDLMQVDSTLYIINSIKEVIKKGKISMEIGGYRYDL